MAADKEKTLAFKITIDGVSQEQIQLQKLEQNLKNLKKEKQELLELSKKEGIMSTDTAAKLAAYDNEIRRLTDNKKQLAKVAGTATDSLTRMRAELIQMKKQAADGSQELNAKMTPAIKKLSDEIQKLEMAQGAHQRNVGDGIFNRSLSKYFHRSPFKKIGMYSWSTLNLVFHQPPSAPCFL